MAGPTPISPTTGTWVVADNWTAPVAAPISPTTGTWVVAGNHTPELPAPIYPTTGTWVVVKCLLPTRFQYNSIGLPAEYSTRQFAVGSNSQG